MEVERSHKSGEAGQMASSQPAWLDLESPRRHTPACAFEGLGLLFEFLVVSSLRQYRCFCACSGAHPSHI